MKRITKIYVSGELTHAGEEIKAVYKKVAEICRPFCANNYVPHAGGTDPVRNPDISPTEVWQRDHRQVATADLLIAYVGKPSLGTGAELEIARITAANIILWWFKGERISRMALGNPAVTEQIEAISKEDLYKKLNDILEKNYEKK